MRQNGIIHPKMPVSLSYLFPSTVSIQSYTSTASASGEETKTWATVSGLSGLPCRVSPTGGIKSKSTLLVYSKATHVITIPAKYTNITVKMRAVDDAGVTYEIIAVLHDDEDVLTKLVCEVVR